MPIKTTAQDAALEQIMELIQRKEIFPGARLFETDLEKSLGMSRTPIRGALDQLVVDGILEKKQNQRGYFFLKLTLSDLYEAYIFRERLEV
ncbi:GntR family transcriptional regulator, partial [Cloacibacillus evryensis]